MNCCNNIRNEKAMIMKNIYELGFALVETMLYLDTHPDDAAAIEYYAEIKDKYVQFMKRYSDYYGPLSMEYLCERYLIDAPSSPSGPPYCEIIIAASVGLQFFILIGY